MTIQFIALIISLMFNVFLIFIIALLLNNLDKERRKWKKKTNK